MSPWIFAAAGAAVLWLVTRDDSSSSSGGSCPAGLRRSPTGPFEAMPTTERYVLETLDKPVAGKLFKSPDVIRATGIGPSAKLEILPMTTIKVVNDSGVAEINCNKYGLAFGVIDEGPDKGKEVYIVPKILPGGKPAWS